MSKKKKHGNVPSSPKHNPRKTLDSMMSVVANADSGRINYDTAARQLGQMTAKMFEGVQLNNRRIKSTPTKPKGMSDEDYKFILDGGILNHEKAARALSYDLGAREYTYRNIIKTYQDVLTYRNYYQPVYGDYDKNTLIREMSLVDKLQKKFHAGQTLKAVTGRALLEGKAFYYHEYRVDKSHNKAIMNRLISLPSDFCMIVDSDNPISKYTVAFDMGYFMEYPDAMTRFGDLFAPWASVYVSCLKQGENALGATRTLFDKEKFEKVYGGMEHSIDIPFPRIWATGAWQYWVILPIDKVWTYEIDDTVPWAAPIFTGLFRAILKLSPAEDIFLELIQNPLVSVLTGEIPYYSDGRGNKSENNFAMSVGDDGFLGYFTDLWRNVLMQLGTQGVGAYFAPFANYKLHQLGEAPNADKILSAAQHGAITKSGLSGIIPATDSVLAGQISVAKKMTAAFPTTIYRTAERMMNQMYENLNLRYSWTHHFFGNVFDDETEIQALEKSMTLGIQPDIYRYNALKGRSVLDDLQMSRVVDDLGLMKYRVPLQSSYHSTKAGVPNWDIGDRDAGAPKTDPNNIESDETESTMDKAE